MTVCFVNNNEFLLWLAREGARKRQLPLVTSSLSPRKPPIPSRQSTTQLLTPSALLIDFQENQRQAPQQTPFSQPQLMPSPMPSNSYGGYGGPPAGGIPPAMGRQSRASPGPGMGNRAAPGMTTSKYRNLERTFDLYGSIASATIMPACAFHIFEINIFSYSTTTIWRCSTTSAE